MTFRKIAVVGLGYVGLPVAVAFGKESKIVGFDISARRIQELKNGIDSTEEVETGDLASARIHYTADLGELKSADFFIVAVPTPVDQANKPDLTPLIKASRSVGSALKKGDIVVFESTVYPGATEEDCVPVLEASSGLKHGVDFFCGYSPERINPGDKEHTFTKIKKIVSACDANTLDIVAKVYGSVVKAGVHKASSIKVAEAAKVIENTQRDLNIALMNELAVVFKRMNIDTQEVLEAAGSKWNFLPFRPGLVGGHCIGVDPYYLTYQAEKLGYIPQVILAGRRINDNMSRFVAKETIKLMIQRGIDVSKSRVGVLGVTFKENCPDVRNSKVVDIVRHRSCHHRPACRCSGSTA
jgi:UDP-N-acetyl-D-glucosamine/UDP-N-acetyl-D-galactosamine dehydrogenase